MDFELPEEMPVMTLPEAVFFPHTAFPLRIFEPRYRRMLRDCLASHRIFGVVNLDPENRLGLAQEEPLFGFATAGLVHTCRAHADGTSELILHGVSRVRITGVVSERPYRLVAIEPVESEIGGPEPELISQRSDLLQTLAVRGNLGCHFPKEIASYLDSLHDHETITDLVAHLFCRSSEFKQRLLETLSVHERYKLLKSVFAQEIEELRLRRKLQGRLEDDNVGTN